MEEQGVTTQEVARNVSEAAQGTQEVTASITGWWTSPAAAVNWNALAEYSDAGLGKSRLCFEFTEKCRVRGIPVYEGHAVSYGRSVPLVPIRRLFDAIRAVQV